MSLISLCRVLLVVSLSSVETLIQNDRNDKISRDDTDSEALLVENREGVVTCLERLNDLFHSLYILKSDQLFRHELFSQ